MDLDTWLATCATELEIDDFRFTNETMHTLLDLARDSAHQVTRVSAPLTTFLVGVAVGARRQPQCGRCQDHCAAGRRSA